jgi:hypothetical protein
MKLEPAWTGLLQAAFKHQNVVQGVADVYYLRRPDIQLPIPPITTIDVTYEAVANLRDVYGVDAEGNLHVSGPVAKVEEMGDRKVITVAGISHGEADEDEFLVDHELGTFFYGNMSLAPDGRVLAVSNTPSFFIYGPDGTPLVSHRALRGGTPRFDPPPDDERPFWEVGAGDVAAGADGFLVGGAPLHRVDHYGYDGTLRFSLRRFEFGGRSYDLEAERVAKVCFDRAGRILAASARQIFVFSAAGEIQDVLTTEAGTDFHLWIGVGADGKLWTQFYKGKEVAYTAFPLPGGAPA